MREFDRVVAALKAGRAAVFPTDTVYGLGVAVAYAPSPQELYALKRRDPGKPIAWLVGSVDDLARYGTDVPAEAQALARAHWPGALTLIVKASDEVPRAYRSQQGTIGLRMPASDEALALIREVGPIAASSANRSGQPAPRTFAEISPDLLGEVAAAMEPQRTPQTRSGASRTAVEGRATRADRACTPASGIASTVLDCTQGKPTIIRQGATPTCPPVTYEGGIMSDHTFSVPLDFTSHDGKTRINAKLWTSSRFGSPDAPGSEAPKAVIQIVHGMAEYIDRYDDLASYLVERGFVVCAEDHIGHGRSAAGPEEYGHMPAHGGKDILIGDAHTLYRMVSEIFPAVPYVMYGHSMGSFITRAYIARHGDELSACVLSGTGSVPAALSKFGRTLSRMLAAMRGETFRSAFIDNMGAGAYGKQIENARTDLDWLSTDDAVVDAYIADELCGFMFTVGGYATLLDLTAEVVTPACAARVPKGLPILLVAGDGDPVGDMGKGVVAAAQLLRDAGVKVVDEKIYSGMRHEIHNEIGHEKVYDDIASWIGDHVD